MRAATRACPPIGIALLAAVGCTRGPSPPPAVLADGSPARPPPVTLQGVDGPTIATRVRMLRSGSTRRGSRAARCIGQRDGTLVERVGASGLSVTIVDPARRAAYGCDGISDRSGWCGRAYGRLRRGQLRDPRLSLTCATHDEPRGFAWIQPGAPASYVVVVRTGYTEVYPVARGVPVRIVTDDVDLSDASAAFSISEHSGSGRRLRAYVLEASVSG